MMILLPSKSSTLSKLCYICLSFTPDVNWLSLQIDMCAWMQNLLTRGKIWVWEGFCFLFVVCSLSAAVLIVLTSPICAGSVCMQVNFHNIAFYQFCFQNLLGKVFVCITSSLNPNSILTSQVANQTVSTWMDGLNYRECIKTLIVNESFKLFVTWFLASQFVALLWLLSLKSK